MSQQTKVKLTSLWKKKAKNGVEYLTGPFGQSTIVIFPNSYKKENKHPDFVAYLSEKPKQPQQQQTYNQQAPQQQQQSAYVDHTQTPAGQGWDDEVPF